MSEADVYVRLLGELEIGVYRAVGGEQGGNHFFAVLSGARLFLHIASASATRLAAVSHVYSASHDSSVSSS